MNTPSSSNPNSPFKGRKRVPIACTNCRAGKLRCRPVESGDSASCERCFKRRLPCEYRPVDPAYNSPPQNDAIYDDDPVNLHPAPSAPPADISRWHQPDVPSSTSGGYAPYQQYYPPAQAPSYSTPHYPEQTSHYQQTSSYQFPPASSYSLPQHPHATLPLAYYADQQSYPTSQFGGSHPPNQPTYHAPPYDYR
ncbi:hypothetical protein BYT27DRAFT_6415797 [Phlegmacium glaucopus]|nr:hypothetical protein BYT27DRAFT_6415797 [Phlegmacium glaucopus]